MAKRYARVNWQDYPSVATPRNAANLNKMDKGIDDCDNAIEAINGILPHLFGIGTYTQNEYGTVRIDGGNIESLTHTGLYYVVGANDSLSNTFNGHLIVNSVTPTETLHIYIPGPGTEIKFRTKWGGVWGAWRTVALT